jgi:hypothetical protein
MLEVGTDIVCGTIWVDLEAQQLDVVTVAEHSVVSLLAIGQAFEPFEPSGLDDAIGIINLADLGFSAHTGLSFDVLIVGWGDVGVV